MPAINLNRYQPKPKQIEKVKRESKSISELLNYDIKFGKKELEDKKKESLYLELSSLLEAGIDLKSSFDLVTDDQKNKNDKQLFTDLRNYIIQGSTFSQALKMSNKFSLYEVFSIQIGEESGKLIEVLKDLAKFYQNKIQQRRKIIAALTYPCVVLSTSLAAVFFMLKFVVPMFGDVFKRFGGELPWITAKIIAISKGVENNFFYFFLITCFAILWIYIFRNTESFRRIFSNVVLKIPVVGNLVQKIYLARFCNSMRLLINARLPLLKAIDLIRQMINYYPIEVSLPVIEKDVLQGMPLHQSFQRFKKIYPSKMIQLVKVGEETNQLDYFFGKISDQYVEEVEYKTSTISRLMEPLIIIFLGLIVGVILIAMYLPLFQMSNSF